MRTSFFSQRPLVPPGVDHPHAEQLQQIGEALERRPEASGFVLNDLTSSGVAGDKGRPGLSAEQVLRILLLKQMCGFSYEELEFHLADSTTYRRFCGFGIADSSPSRSTLQRNIKAITPETLERISQIVTGDAIDERIEDAKSARVDSSVVNAAIHEPSDSSLLYDSVRVLVRLLKRAAQRTNVKFKNQRRRAKKRALEIQNARSEDERLPLYRDLLDVAEAAANDALGALESMYDVHGQGAQGEEIDGLVRELQYYVAVTRRVIDQARRRVLQGERVPAQEKIVSIFEPHVDIIVKDRRETLYGHKVFFSAGKSGLVFDVVIARGNPADSSMASPMMKRHVELYGKAPKQVAFDGGFASRENLEQIKKLGVRDVVFTKSKGLEIGEMAKSPRIFRALRRFRAGIESTISFLKRSFGLDRCDWRTFQSFKAYVWGSVLAANLLTIARASAG
jgi:IS5 family transposase